MKKKLKIMLLAILCLCFAGGAAGCALMDDAINDIKGDLVGNGYTIRTYDNYGQKVMTTVGDKINVQGNPVKTASYNSDGKTDWTIPPVFIPQSRLSKMAVRYFICMTNPHLRNQRLYGR